MNKLRRQMTNSSIKSIPNEEIDYYTVIEVKNHLVKLNKENEDAFEEKDFLKYVNDTKQLRRFIQRTGKVDESVKYCSNILHWRRELGLYKLSLASFPRECYSYNFYHVFENALNGNICAVVSGKYFLKGPYTREVSHKFICFMCYWMNDKLVAKGEEFGLTIIFDSRNISLSQYDIDFISFLIDILTTKMPNIIKQIVLYEVPWYGMPLLKTILLLLPSHWRKVIVHANSKTIKKYVAKESLPVDFPASTRKEPIERLTTLEDKKPLKDFTEEELNLIGMKKENVPEYLKLIKIWDNIESKK